MKTHECFAHGCTEQVKPSLLMCPRHWRMVPRPLQTTIHVLYRRQVKGEDVSEEAWQARFQAVVSVADAEGKEVPKAYRRWAGQEEETQSE